MSIITIADITDSEFKRIQTDPEKQAYVDQGIAKLESLCTQKKIDYSQISQVSAPYTAKSIACTAALIAFCRDRVGGSWREIREGFSIDTYKAKLDVLQADLDRLYETLTPELCGIASGSGTNNTFAIGRA